MQESKIAMSESKDFIGFPEVLNKRWSEAEFHETMLFRDFEVPIEHVVFVDHPDISEIK